MPVTLSSALGILTAMFMPAMLVLACGPLMLPTSQRLSRTFDLRLPTGSAAAGGAQFVFTACAQSTSTTLTPALLPVAATPLAATWHGTVSFGAGSTLDSLAFNLSTGLNEPAASSATKALQVNGLARTDAFTLNAQRHALLVS